MPQVCFKISFFPIVNQSYAQQYTEVQVAPHMQTEICSVWAPVYLGQPVCLPEWLSSFVYGEVTSYQRRVTCDINGWKGFVLLMRDTWHGITSCILSQTVTDVVQTQFNKHLYFRLGKCCCRKLFCKVDLFYVLCCVEIMRQFTILQWKNVIFNIGQFFICKKISEIYINRFRHWL